MATRTKAHLAKTPGRVPVSAEETAAVMLARDMGVPLREAVLSWKAATAAAASVTVEDLVTRRLEAMAMEGHSARYAAELRQFLKRVREHWPETPLVDLTAEAAAGFIFSAGGGGGMGAKTMRKRKTLLVGLLNFAESLGLLRENPARKIKTPKPGAGRIALLSPAQSRDYLLAVVEAAPEALAAEAVSMFAGLRRAEVERLQWEQVWLDRGLIEVGAAQAKTRQRRLVTIEPALQGILEQVAQTKGPVRPWNYRGLLHRAHTAAGWRDKKGTHWPINALRHGFVSYHLALYNDVARTELQAGHEKVTLFRNYRELVTPAEAEEFWSTALVL